MVSARRLQAGVHAALIGLAIPYVWFNTGLPISLSDRDGIIGVLGTVLSALGWVLIFAIVIYMSNRDGADPFAFDWKDRIPLAGAFVHGTATNLVIRESEGYPMSVVILSFVFTFLFGILCVGAIVIDLIRRRSDEDDMDADEGLILDGGEEGALSLTETARVPWPTYFDSPRLKRYRAAGAASLLALTFAAAGKLQQQSGPRAWSWVALIALTLACVPLVLVVRGPWGSSGKDRYYPLAQGTLSAANVTSALGLCLPGYGSISANILARIPQILMLLGAGALQFVTVRYDRTNPAEDAEGAPALGEDVEAAILFDPDAEEIH